MREGHGHGHKYSGLCALSVHCSLQALAGKGLEASLSGHNCLEALCARATSQVRY